MCVCVCVCVNVCICMMCVGVSVHVCVCLMCVCLAFRVMLNGMTKVATPLLASSSSLGRPIGAARVFNSKYLFHRGVILCSQTPPAACLQWMRNLALFYRAAREVS